VPLSCNLGTLTSWKPLGHSRSVTGLLYLIIIIIIIIIIMLVESDVKIAQAVILQYVTRKSSLFFVIL